MMNARRLTRTWRGNRGLACHVVLAAGVVVALAGSARAQAADQGTQSTSPPKDPLAEALRLAQDPLAKVRSLGIDSGVDRGSGRNRYSLQLLPLYEVKTRRTWDILTRAIVPVTGAPTVLAGTPATAWGLGDITLQAVVVPATKGPIEYGIGPQVSLRTRTDDAIGGPGWGGGVLGIVFGAAGPVSYGAIMGHHWGQGTFSRTSIQPLLLYTMTWFGRGSYVGYRNTINYNWRVAGSKKWVVPVGLTVGKTTRIARGYLVDLNVSGYAFAANLAGQADRQLKLGFSVLFP